MDPEGRGNPLLHRSRRRKDHGPRMGIRSGKLLPIQQRLTAVEVHARPFAETVTLEPLEIVPHRIWIDQQGVDDVSHRASSPK